MTIRFIVFPNGAGTTYTISPSGSINFTGTNIQTHEKVTLPTGNVSFTGSAAITFVPGIVTYTITPSGNVTFSGTVSQAHEKFIPPTGGIQFDGTTSAIYERVFSSSGVITFSGSAPIYVPGVETDITKLTLTFAGKT